MRTSPLLLTILLVSALSTHALGQTPLGSAQPSSAQPSAVQPAATQPAATQPAAPKSAPAASPASVAPAPAPAAPAGPEVKIKDTELAPGVAAKSGKDAAGHDTLSVDFPEEEIRNILRNVADLFELNLVIPESLQGKTTVKLRDVTWRQIFQVVLNPVGYTYVEDGSIIKIVSNESLQQEPTSTEVFILNYARAADILPTITSLVDAAAGGKIVVDARSNALVITERPTRFNRIRPIIESLDRATDQVMIESKFVEVTDSDVKNLGVNWASLQNYHLGVNPSGTFNRTRGQTLSDGSNGNTVNQNGTTGSTANTTTAGQNTGSTTSNNVTSTGGVVTGTSTTGSTGDITNAITNTIASGTTTSGDTTLNLLNSIANTGGTDRALTAVFTADQFGLVLSALTALNKTRIVSNPTIVTLNNTEATINVGEEYPIPRYQYNQQTGSFEVSGFEYRPIGILLKVTPQVNARGFVKLNLDPEVSLRSGVSTFGTASIPIIATRKAHTQVSLKDGSTLGIGGMMRKQTTNGTTKVPVLGDIPILGYAFKTKSTDAETTNLLIFITAKVVSAEGASTEQIFDPNQVRDIGLKKSDLPGYRETTSALLPDEDPAKAGKKSWFGLGNTEAK
jgi:type II secretory pathway component GspD/PulD (secretin)